MPENKSETKNDIIERLHLMMSAKGDFPAMSHTINLIKKQTTQGGDTSVTELANTILNDFALTNRLLRMVNTVFYVKYQMSGKITTISRAVNILGFNQVRNAALSLILFENLTNKSLTADLKESFVMTLVSGIIARELAPTIGISDIEEAFVCSMFHEFGRLLLSFYMPDTYGRVRDDAARRKIDEEKASLELLGASLETIGTTVAGYWHFSEELIYCMQKIKGHEKTHTSTTIEKLRCLANFSNRVCAAIAGSDDPAAEWKKSSAEFIGKFGSCIAISEPQVSKALSSAFCEISKYAREFRFKPDQISFLRKINAIVTPSRAQKDAAAAPSEPIPTTAPGNVGHLVEKNGIHYLELIHEDFNVAETPEEILSKGVQEIAGALLEDFSLNDLLRMILEVMYRGMEFTTVLICIRNTKEPLMAGRFGFGPDISELIKGFQFRIDTKSEDVFNISLSEDQDVLINDAWDERISKRIPAWYRKLTASGSFILIPITVMKMPIGMIYADKEKADEIAVTPSMLRYIKTLRNQALLAIKQRM